MYNSSYCNWCILYLSVYAWSAKRYTWLTSRMSCCRCHIFTARRIAGIASAVLAIAIPSVRPSVCPSVTRQYCVKTTERRMILSSLEDRKMCLVFRQPKKRPPRNDRFPLKCCPKSSEFWHILPCSASTVRDRKRRSTTLNKKLTRAFQRAINQGSMLSLTSSQWGLNT